MKSNFLKSRLFLALGFTTAVFYSCDKDDENEVNDGSVLNITATNVINSSTRITTVKVLAYYDSDSGYGNDAIAQAPYKNNGFTLELPATVPAKYLELVFEDEDEDIPGINISDKNAKILVMEDIAGFDEDENEIGYFYLEEENDDSEYYTSWIYADRDLTIKGESKEIDDDYEDIEKYDLKLKKGWNVMYASYTESYNNSKDKEVYTFSYTSQKPSGVNYSWYFYGYSGYFSSPQATAKPVEKTKSVFSKLKKERKNRIKK